MDVIGLRGTPLVGVRAPNAAGRHRVLVRAARRPRAQHRISRQGTASLPGVLAACGRGPPRHRDSISASTHTHLLICLAFSGANVTYVSKFDFTPIFAFMVEFVLLKHQIYL